MDLMILNKFLSKVVKLFSLQSKPAPNTTPSSARALNKHNMAFALVIAGSSASLTECQALQLVTVYPQTPYNVSRYEDIKLMRRYFQGASWESPISTQSWDLLKTLGISTTRIINVESRESIQIDPETKERRFDFSSSRLADALNDCKAYNLNPHIIVGQVPQNSLLKTTHDGRHYGISDWNAYEAYAYAFLEFVTLEKNFPQADFEVGNEPDINLQSWLLDESVPYGSSKMYNEYLKLYTAWANASEKLAQAHPELNFRIGGPSITPYSFGFNKINWADRFLGDVSAKQLRLDFFSFHFYGNNQSLIGLPKFGRYPAIEEFSTRVHDKLDNLQLGDIPIFLSEWGASHNIMPAKGIINANNIGAAWAARFLMDAVEANIDEGALLSFRDQLIPDSTDNNWKWPSLLQSDGVTPKALYNVAMMFNRLPNRRVKTTPMRQGSVGVVAGANNSKVDVLLFNQHWDFLNASELATSTQTQITIKQLPFVTSKVSVIKYVVDETNANPYYSYINSDLNSAAIRKANGLRAIRMHNVPVNNGSITLPIVELSPSSVTLFEILPEATPNH